MPGLAAFSGTQQPQNWPRWPTLQLALQQPWFGVARFHLVPPPTSVTRLEAIPPAGIVHAESVKLYIVETDLKPRSS